MKFVILIDEMPDSHVPKVVDGDFTSREQAAQWANQNYSEFCNWSVAPVMTAEESLAVDPEAL